MPLVLAGERFEQKLGTMFNSALGYIYKTISSSEGTRVTADDVIDNGDGTTSIWIKKLGVRKVGGNATLASHGIFISGANWKSVFLAGGRSPCANVHCQ